MGGRKEKVTAGKGRGKDGGRQVWPQGSQHLKSSLTEHPRQISETTATFPVRHSFT